MKHDKNLVSAAGMEYAKEASRAGLRARTPRLPDVILSEGVLVLLDAENLIISASALGFALEFSSLRNAICGLERRSGVDFHAFYTKGAGDTALSGVLERHGWSAHPRPPIRRTFGPGPRLNRNADNWFAFGAAHLLASGKYGCAVLGTGDGLLGLDVARCIRAAVPSCKTVATLSVAGSTSSLLDARKTPEIDVNLAVGRDALRQLH